MSSDILEGLSLAFKALVIGVLTIVGATVLWVVLGFLLSALWSWFVAPLLELAFMVGLGLLVIVLGYYIVKMVAPIIDSESSSMPQ